MLYTLVLLLATLTGPLTLEAPIPDGVYVDTAEPGPSLP